MIEDEDLGCMPTLVTFDPGGVTGWCVMQVHPEALSVPGYTVLDNIEYWAQGEIDAIDENQHIHDMAKLVSVWPGAAVVVEDFILGSARKNRDMLSPVRLTAGLKYALWLDGRSLWLQSPADRLVATDVRLKAWGYYVVEGGQGHARDATRHALVWLRKARGPSAGAVALRARVWPAFYGTGGVMMG